MLNRLERLIKEIASDNRSGAMEILHRAAEVFYLLADEQKGVDAKRAHSVIIATSSALVRAQPDMAALANLASSAIAASSDAPSADEAFKQAAEAARSFSERVARRARQTISHAVDLISEGAIILTHSRSSTVLAALIAAHSSGRHIQVIATESRPLLEGRTLACSLAGEGIKVTLIADAAAALMIGRAGLVIVGADRVTPYNLVNKIGTRMIALAARECGKPIYALSDTSKFIAAPIMNRERKSGDEIHDDEIHDDEICGDEICGDEIWPDAPQGIEVVNRYFEPTPLIYFAAIVTEDGQLTPAEARRRAESQPVHQALLDALNTPQDAQT